MALLLLSGGLDSTLAGKLLLDMGIEVVAVNFTSPFCRCTPKSHGCSAARKAAEGLGVPVRHFSSGEDYLEVMKNPRFGRGKGMNACIDCRIYIFRRAGDYMREIGADFLATGEVLGERPMSQHRKAMETIEHESGVAGRIVRPLSARLLPPSEPEKTGLVEREKLLAIEGRCRAPQMRLAEEAGIKDYPCPAGGCLLTDKEFAARFEDLLGHEPGFGLREARLLTVGRHFRLPSGGKVLIGRNEAENEALGALRGENEPLLEPVDLPGPSALCTGGLSGDAIKTAARLVALYTEGGREVDVSVAAGDGDSGASSILRARPLEKHLAAEWRVSAANRRQEKQKMEVQA